MTFEQQPICTDDFGNEVYIGHWTGKIVASTDARYFGAIIPQANCRYIDLRDEGLLARKESYRTFCDSEQNCNTCRHLKRVPHKKNAHSLMAGICLSAPVNHPYRVGKNNEILFHPDDWMGMQCYESRWA